jgi:hypothetical protein
LLLVHINRTNGELAVRCLCSAVTAGKVVDDKGGDLVARNLLESRLDGRDLGASIAKITLAANRIII